MNAATQETGPSPFFPPIGVTPLMYAISGGQVAAANRLIGGGANVNAADEKGRTALMRALPHVELVRLLLAAGARPTDEDQYHSTVLSQARSYPQARELIEKSLPRPADAGTTRLPQKCVARRTMVDLPTGFARITLVDSQTLGPAGPGGDAFEEAIQNSNADRHQEAIASFDRAIAAGLDALREGYANGNVGVMLLDQGDLAGAVDRFVTVLCADRALNEAVFKATAYLSLIVGEQGRPDDARELAQVAGKAGSNLGVSLAPTAAEKVRRLVRSGSV